MLQLRLSIDFRGSYNNTSFNETHVPVIFLSGQKMQQDIFMFDQPCQGPQPWYGWN